MEGPEQVGSSLFGHIFSEFVSCFFALLIYACSLFSTVFSRFSFLFTRVFSSF